MPTVHRVSDLLNELQHIERTAATAHGALILEAFRRHTPFGVGAVYLRDGRDPSMRLSAKSHQAVAPEIFDAVMPEALTTATDGRFEPQPAHLLPLRAQREALGIVALMKAERSAASDEDLDLLRTAQAFLSTVLANHRLLQETREGDFQLKYRLWELESLYDIGLSIASTLNIDELADEILFRMISLTNARRAALFLREGGRFKLYRSFGEVRSEFLDEELAGELVRDGTPLSFTDGNECVFPECQAFVALPIRGNNAIIGVLAAADRETREGGIGAFEPNELRLLSQFASQASIALENSRLHREALENQAMQRDMELAATIQRDILPKSIPVVTSVDISVLARPARQVGGDYHAFVERDGVLTMVVADVAGKSMPAALLVSALHAAVQLLFAEGRELGDVATELNKHIHRWSAENKFITMVMVSIDRENETLEFVNAGHNPAYVLSAGRLDQVRSHGVPIGILPQARYVTQMLPFPSGSSIVLYSDGITEAENAEGEEYGNDRLEAILRDRADASPHDLRDAIVSAVDAFVGGAAQKDDQTLVIARTDGTRDA
jgi:sigma-B regulation protein RsbU (phosphoserine phosphatase)